MKELLSTIKNDIQQDKNVEESQFHLVLSKLQELYKECENNNVYVEMPTIETLNQEFAILNNAEVFKDKKSSPLMWGNLYSQIHNEVKRIEEITKENLFDKKDISDFDGFQVYKEQLEPVKEHSLEGVGAFDAMFMGMENDVIKKKNSKPKGFSVSVRGDNHYVNFECGKMIEHSLFNVDDNLYFSHVNLDAYNRYNMILKLEDDSFVQIVASKNYENNKQQISIYFLNENAKLRESKEYNVIQYISFGEEKGVSKYVAFKEDYVTEFNSKTFSFIENKVVFKGVCSILKNKNESIYELFKEPKFKGFDFPYLEESESHKKLKKEKTDETLSFKLAKNQGGRKQGDKANNMQEDLIQSDIFLLEDFTNLEQERIAFNVKETINIPNIHDLNYDVEHKLIELMAGNLYKFEATDAINVYTSNIEPRFGKVLSKRLFEVTKEDVMVSEYVEYKTMIVNDQIIENVENEALMKKEEVSFDGYVFDFKTVDTVDDRQNKKELLGQVVVCKEEFIETGYKIVEVKEDISEFLMHKFAMAPVRGDFFLYDRRRFYENNLTTLFESLGAKKVDIDFKAKKLEKIVLNMETVEFLGSVQIDEEGNEKRNPIFVVDIQMGDSEYHKLFDRFEDFPNPRVFKVFEPYFKNMDGVITEHEVDKEHNRLLLTVEGQENYDTMKKIISDIEVIKDVFKTEEEKKEEQKAQEVA
jgi:hypothetical protein